jgi:hypothetical protein
MANRFLLAKRINNGQSEIWFSTEPETKLVVATNGVLFPIRTICSPEESAAFHKVFNEGAATVPATVMDRLMSDFGLNA